MKTSRPEKKLSCAHADSNSTFPYRHIGAATGNGYTVTMAKEDNEFLTGALKNSIMGKKRFRSPGPPRGILEVGAGRGNSSRPTGSLRYPCRTMIHNQQISNEKAGFVTYSFLKESFWHFPPGCTTSNGNHQFGAEKRGILGRQIPLTTLLQKSIF